MSEDKNMTQADIDVIEYPECVRKRPGMYLNTPDQCIFEIVDNAVDEYMAGRCNCISVDVIDETVSITDNGGGIPIKPSHTPGYENIPMVEVAMTTLHAGGKFGMEGGYKSSTGGMNGVGASCVNAVSDKFDVYIKADGNKYYIGFEKGVTVSKLQEVEKLSEDDLQHGTTVTFILDKTIWKTKWYDFDHVINRLRQIAYLNPGLTITFNIDSHDEENNPVALCDTYLFPEGITGYVNEITEKKEKLIDTEKFSGSFDYYEERKVNFEMAMLYVNDYTSTVKSFVNNVGTELGGEHKAGALLGIASAIKAFTSENNLVKDVKVLSNDDCFEGLRAIISIKLLDPNFAGQSKEKLNMPELKTPVKKFMEDAFKDYLDRDYDRAIKIVNKALAASRAREAARKARNAARSVKQAVVGTVPDLADCSSKNPEECEIFFVEGDSAGGSAKMARDRRTQAILPIFGKILNASKKTAETVVKSVKLADMVKALRTGIGKDFNITNLRYHKIILMADADSDGGHIQCLHMTNFYRTMKPLIMGGYVYAACPPLYKVTAKNGKKESHTYLYTTEELDDFRKRYGDSDNRTITRFKGLEEPSPYYLFRLSAGS